MAERKKISAKKTTAKTNVKKKNTVNKNEVSKKKTRKVAPKKELKKTVEKSVINVKKTPEDKKEMSVLSRFWQVFTPSFLGKLVKEKSSGRSWGFWFLSNLFLVLVPLIAFFFFQNNFFAGFPENLVNKIHSDEGFSLNGQAYKYKDLIRNFEFSINQNGVLSSKNIPDPIVLAAKNGEENFLSYSSPEQVDEYDTSFVFVLDTKGAFSEKQLGKNFANFVYILPKHALVFDGQKSRTQFIEYKKIIENEEISNFPKKFNFNSLQKAKPYLKGFLWVMILFFTFFLYLFLSVARLLNALIWSLVYWALGSVFKIREWSFDNSFKAMLHFSFITMIFVPLAFVWKIPVFLYALIVLTLFFAMNFWAMKNNS